MTAKVWISVDVGGTFTDAVAYDLGAGTLRWAKAPSTPADPAAGVLAAMSLLLDDLSALDRFVHGVTIGTNAIIERKGADVWVVTTAGFRDTLEIQRTERRELYNIKTLKPAPFVPRARVLEAGERLRYDGSVYRALAPAECGRIAGRLRDAGAQSVAVCFLHSFANDAHESAMLAAIEAAIPEVYACASSEVLPEIREYERFSTAVLNAYIGPLMSRYLAALRGLLTARGFRRTVFLMTSNGGVMSAERARRFPVQTVLSGPAGGVTAAIEFGRLLEIDKLIAYDMGGTSTDVCLVDGFQATFTTEQMLAGHPIRTPQMEIVTIGAGGGSIAWLDDGQMLKVGPASAGAEPGPAAYGRGGTEPTVTDANLILGRLSGETRLAETLALDASPARAALDRLARRMAGLDAEALADGVIRIAVARMVSAIKEISIARGHDPRDFTLLAYGGAGPMHGTFVAEELDIGHVVVPPSPGNFSAFGCLVSDLQQTRTRTLLLETRRGAWRQVAQAFGALEREGRQGLEAEGVEGARIGFRRELGMRYLGQSWELAVSIGDGVDSMKDAEAAFRAAHEQRYGHGSDDPAEIVTVRVTAVGRMDKPLIPDPPGAAGASAGRTRPVWFDGGYRDTAVYPRAALGAGTVLSGPVLVEEMGSVTVVPPGWSLVAGARGAFHLRRERTSGAQI
ncbi:MAG TPA: hydantoinase/oxoprolinase family protein [Gammaproteobacteria bacterium]